MPKLVLDQPIRPMYSFLMPKHRLVLDEEEPIVSEDVKRMFASTETSGNISANWLQLEPTTFEDLKSRKKIDKDIKFEDIKKDTKLYDKVARSYIDDLKTTFKIPTDREAALWSFRPAYYKKYGGDISKIPEDKPGSFGKSARQVMEKRERVLKSRGYTRPKATGQAPRLVLDEPVKGPRLVLDEPEKTPLQEGGEIAKEAGKGILRGFENLAAGVGSTTQWIGENIKEGMPRKIAQAAQLLPKQAPEWVKSIEKKIGDKIATWGKNAYSFWQEESTRGIETPDIETFKGTFMQNPSWTRAVATIAEAIPSLAGATVVGIATQNPLAGAASLGLIEGSGQYVEAREAGKNVRFSNIVGGLSTVGTSVLEVLPLTRFVRGGAGKVGKDIFLGAVQEGGEEVLQALWQNAIAKIGYDNTRALTAGIVEGFIGGAGSGGVLGGLTSGRGIQTDNLIKEAVSKGVTPQEINTMQEAVKNQIINNADKIEGMLAKSAQDEARQYEAWLKSRPA